MPPPATAGGPAADEIRFDDGTSEEESGDRETLVLEDTTSEPEAAPAQASPTDLSGRSAYTRVLMGGKSEGSPRPSTPSPSAERAQRSRRSTGPAAALKSVPTWVLGAAGAVVTVIVVFILLAIFG